LLNNYN